MNIDVILGLQWGDEGKGKIVDAIANNYDIIARFQGGPNAGHTIQFGNKKFVLHTIPSGIFHKDITNVVGNGVVLDPVIFKNEIDNIVEAGYNPFDNLIISERTHLILPSHRMLDAVYESALGNKKIGSTLKGIGPAYTDKYQRKGFRVGDIFDINFENNFRKRQSEYAEVAKSIYPEYESILIDKMSYHEYEEVWLNAISFLKKFQIKAGEIFINKALNSGKKVLAEGAQGSLLDVDFGAYPFVTSSNTTTGGVCTGLGVPPRSIGKVYGIFKAYCTRVGNGPFPTELDNEMGEHLRNEGHEFGATTGRPRRCGWLDLPALRYAIMINGVTDLVITKADVLSGLETINVCNTYNCDGKEYQLPEFAYSKEFTPSLTDMEGWKDDITKSVSMDQLPQQFTTYLNFINKALQCPISIVSVGPERDQTIKL